MPRILIAEDEPRIASFVEKGLRASGFTTTVVGDGVEALAMARSDLFDLLVLDLGLPGRDGLSVLRELRAGGTRLPVVILTARAGVEEMVEGLDLGADDYVTKPFRFEELLARIRARLRTGETTTSNSLEVAGAVLDVRERTVTLGDQVEDLTAREFSLAELFFRHAGQVLTREQILSHVWGYDYDPGSNVVDVYIGYLRRKLAPDAIETVRGAGYRLRKDPA